jgi:hypothetical protein
MPLKLNLLVAKVFNTVERKYWVGMFILMYLWYMKKKFTKVSPVKLPSLPYHRRVLRVISADDLDRFLNLYIGRRYKIEFEKWTLLSPQDKQHLYLMCTDWDTRYAGGLDKALKIMTKLCPSVDWKSLSDGNPSLWPYSYGLLKEAWRRVKVDHEIDPHLVQYHRALKPTGSTNLKQWHEASVKSTYPLDANSLIYLVRYASKDVNLHDYLPHPSRMVNIKLNI